MGKGHKRLLTLDQTIAANIRRLRDGHRWTRKELAKKLSEITNSEVSEWRIIDIEGARSRTKPPRSSTWPELVALCAAFDVYLYELLLPQDDSKVIVFPDYEDVRPKKRLTLSLSPARTRAQLAGSLFGLTLLNIDHILAGDTKETLPEHPPDDDEQRQRAALQLLEVLERSARSGELIDALKKITEDE